MNTRHCVHFASQSPPGSDSLAISRPHINEFTSIDIYDRLAANNGVDCWFMPGHQQPGDYTAKGHAAHWENSDRFGKSVAAGVHFYQPPADEAPLPVGDRNPQRLRTATKGKRNDAMSDQELLIDIRSFFYLICNGIFKLYYPNGKDFIVRLLTMLSAISFLGTRFNLPNREKGENHGNPQANYRRCAYHYSSDNRYPDST